MSDFKAKMHQIRFPLVSAHRGVAAAAAAADPGAVYRRTVCLLLLPLTALSRPLAAFNGAYL